MQTRQYVNRIAAGADPSTAQATASDRVTSFAYDTAGRHIYTLDAQVVSYDPDRDLSILAVPNLSAAALSFARSSLFLDSSSAFDSSMFFFARSSAD